MKITYAKQPLAQRNDNHFAILRINIPHVTLLPLKKLIFPNANDCIPPLSANPQNTALKFDCFMSTVDFDKKIKVIGFLKLL